MNDINLLPWREAKREKEKKQFNVFFAVSLLLSALCVGLIYYHISLLIEQQQSVNRLLSEEIDILNGKIKAIKKLKKLRAELIARMSVIQKLQENRPLTVHLVDEIIKVLPKGIFITQIKRKGDLVMLTGQVESNSSVSILMRNIHASPWINKPKLSEIKTLKASSGPNASVFSLSFVLKPKSIVNLLL